MPSPHTSSDGSRQPRGGKRFEAALRKANKKLEDLVQARTAELEAKNAALTAEILEHKRTGQALRESERSMRTITKNLPDVGILQFIRTPEGNGSYSFASESLKQLFGVPSHTALTADGRYLESLVHPEDNARFLTARQAAAKNPSFFEFEGRILTPKGQVKWLQWRAAARRAENGDAVWDTALVDITQRKLAEAALKRANRALLVLKHCDEALVRACNETELLHLICSILVEIGGAKMAWVGFANNDKHRTVRPVASAGDDGYLDIARISWADALRGRGPIGTAIRTSQTRICHNLALDRTLAPWKKELLKRGYAAIIALPLIWDKQCWGTLTIYSGDHEAFKSTEEVELLEQLAGDLAYGIFALRTRAERARLEHELLEISEREKQIIAQELHDGLCQHLAATALMGALLHRRLAATNSPEAEFAQQICDLLNTGTAEARNLSHGLHSVRPIPEGLMEALLGLAQNVTQLLRIPCSLLCEPKVLLDNSTTSTHLFRIAQEAVNNAVRHGKSSEVRISLSCANQSLLLSITDNGTGFPRKLPAARGMGLQIMKHRAAAIGATVEVRRNGRRGTVVSCTLPLPPGASDLISPGSVRVFAAPA